MWSGEWLKKEVWRQKLIKDISNWAGASVRNASSVLLSGLNTVDDNENRIFQELFTLRLIHTAIWRENYKIENVLIYSMHNHHRPSQIGLFGPVSRGPTPPSWHLYISTSHTDTVSNISSDSDLFIFTTFIAIVLMILLYVLQINPSLCSVSLKW